MPGTQQVVLIGSLIERPALDQGEGQEPVVYMNINRLPVTDYVRLPYDVQRPKGDHKVVVTGELMMRMLSVYIPDDAVLMIQGQLVPNMWSPGVAGIEATKICFFATETHGTHSLDAHCSGPDCYCSGLFD